MHPRVLSSSVQICDTTPHPTRRNPTNHVPVENEDCVITSQFFDTYDIHRSIVQVLEYTPAPDISLELVSFCAPKDMP